MPTGSIKSFDQSRGVGVIEMDGGGQMTVYKTDLQDLQSRHLDPGDWVEFDIAQMPEGPKAVNVHKML